MEIKGGKITLDDTEYISTILALVHIAKLGSSREEYNHQRVMKAVENISTKITDEILEKLKRHEIEDVEVPVILLGIYTSTVMGYLYALFGEKTEKAIESLATELIEEILKKSGILKLGIIPIVVPPQKENDNKPDDNKVDNAYV